MPIRKLLLVLVVLCGALGGVQAEARSKKSKVKRTPNKKPVAAKVVKPTGAKRFMVFKPNPALSTKFMGEPKRAGKVDAPLILGAYTVLQARVKAPPPLTGVQKAAPERAPGEAAPGWFGSPEGGEGYEGYEQSAPEAMIDSLLGSGPVGEGAYSPDGGLGPVQPMDSQPLELQPLEPTPLDSSLLDNAPLDSSPLESTAVDSGGFDGADALAPVSEEEMQATPGGTDLQPVEPVGESGAEFDVPVE